MFAGWRITNDMDTLVNLKQGRFKLDILNQQVLLNEQPYSGAIHIADEISSWFDKDLLDNNIPKSSIVEANLVADFTVEVLDGKPKSRTKKIVSIDLRMTATIRTDEKEYSTQKSTANEYHYIDSSKNAL